MPSPAIDRRPEPVLQITDGGGLVLGSLLGEDLVDPDASADGLGGATVVAGDHHGVADAGRLEGLHG